MLNAASTLDILHRRNIVSKRFRLIRQAIFIRLTKENWKKSVSIGLPFGIDNYLVIYNQEFPDLRSIS